VDKAEVCAANHQCGCGLMDEGWLGPALLFYPMAGSSRPEWHLLKHQ